MSTAFRLIAQMGVVGIDHIAVTTDNFKGTLYEYLALPLATLLRGPGWNERQKVDYAFVKTGEGVVIEVLGARESSPIETHVKHGGGIYHFCYIVRDINRAVDAIRNNKGRIVIEPTPDVAFDERPIAFVFHPNLGFFEIVAMSHAVFEKSSENKIPEQVRTSVLKNISEIENQLIRVMQKELKIDDSSAIKQAELGSSPNWDSLSHLKIAMAIETVFDVSIDSGDLYRLRSFDDILSFLKEKIKDDGDN